MSKFTTLVFRADTSEQVNVIHLASNSEHCIAWSIDHEILRLELIDKALDDGNIDRAKFYIKQLNIINFIDDLKDEINE